MDVSYLKSTINYIIQKNYLESSSKKPSTKFFYFRNGNCGFMVFCFQIKHINFTLLGELKNKKKNILHLSGLF